LKSKPEPDPVFSGEPVPDKLISFLQSSNIDGNVLVSAVKLIRARDAFGRDKYGQPLMSKDGRDDIEDAMQELGDLMQYAFKARMNGRSLDKLRELTVALDLILNG